MKLEANNELYHVRIRFQSLRHHCCKKLAFLNGLIHFCISKLCPIFLFSFEKSTLQLVLPYNIHRCGYFRCGFTTLTSRLRNGIETSR